MSKAIFLISTIVCIINILILIDYKIDNGLSIIESLQWIILIIMNIILIVFSFGCIFM